MPFNILHFSDLHGKLPAIPVKYWNTDVTIVLSGDICDNYPDHWQVGVKQGTLFTPTAWNGPWNFRRINGTEEGRLQNEWIETVLLPHFVKCGIPVENVIAVNGNHDWADFDKYFPNAIKAGAKTILYRGIKIGLMVGVPQFTSEWYEELSEWGIEDRLKQLDPEIEILVTHTPPYSVLDRGHGQDRIGSQALYTLLFGKSVFEAVPPFFNNVKLHLFGHAHAAKGGKHFDFDDRKLKCYNAAGTRFELDFPFKP